MLNLDGVIDVGKMHDVSEYTHLRFRDRTKLVTPEALTLYEQKYLKSEEIKALCEKQYGHELYEPIVTYVPEEIVNQFADSNLVPVMYGPMTNKIIAVYIPELDRSKVVIPHHTIEERPTTIYYFLDVYQKYFGTHKILQDIPSKMILDMVVKEAIELQAADITISTVGKGSNVYYNVRKNKVKSNRIFSYEHMTDIIKYLCVKSPIDFTSRQPKYVDVDLNREYRGRVLINTKYKGYVITIRLLPNAAFDNEIDSLNMTDKSAKWLEKNFLDRETGLRLIVGETMSGKNTTALSLLRKVAQLDRYKIVSIEMPVEQELYGIEQINTETIEEYENNIKSLIHQNPDFVYITEIRDSTGRPTVQITNTGKRVMSTLHANSVADTISRLVDITGLSIDRIIQTLHSICYQELVRDNDKDIVYPRNRYVRFTQELKYELYGKSLGEVIKKIRDVEEGDTWISA